MNIIILLGLRVRSGTNFVGATLKMHPDVQTIPPDTSLGEFNLFRDEFIKNKVFYSITNRSFASGVKQEDFPQFMKLYGELWQKFLVEKFNLDSEKTLFLKSPRIHETHLWQLAFPDSKIALLSRDGRDNIISSIKGSNDRRSWHKAPHKITQKLNFYTGRFFLNFSKDWALKAEKFNSIQESLNLKKFKYENLNDSYDGIEELLRFYELDHNKVNVEKCMGAPVMGSSFGIENEIATKPNWTPDFDKAKFNFTGKWGHWNKLQKETFKKIAGQQLIDLDYEKDLNW